MKGPGILWMLQTAAGMSMAGPMFFLGLESLRTGRYTWAGFYLVLGAIVLYFPTYLVNRIGGPRTWIRRRLGRDGTADGENGANEANGGGSDSATGSSDGSDGSIAVLERFRR